MSDDRVRLEQNEVRSSVRCKLPTSEPADRYRRYQQALQEFDDDVEQFERVAVWWDETRPTL